MDQKILELSNASTCWDEKPFDTIAIKNSITSIYEAVVEIPALTRIVIEQPRLMYVKNKNHRFSDDKKEILFHGTYPLPQASITKLQECLIVATTPLTRQPIGFAIAKEESVYRYCIKSKGSDSSCLCPSNCMVYIDFVNNWQYGIITTRHIHKGESLSIQFDKPVKLDMLKIFQIDKVVALRPFLPESAIPLLLLHEGVKSKSSSSKSWNQFLLWRAIDILQQEDSKAFQNMQVLIQDFNKTYTKNRSSAPLVIHSLFMEALFNTQVNDKWMSIFGVKVIMYASKLT